MRGTFAWAALAACVACSSSSSSSPPTEAQGGPKGSGAVASAVVGTSGGVVTNAEGAKLTIPAGALGADTKITITSTTGTPAGVTSWNSPMFSLEPTNTIFTKPATLDVTMTGSPTSPALWISTSSGITPLPGTVSGSTLSVSLMGLGVVYVAPLETTTPRPPGGDACAPYAGSYAGILTFQWSTYTGGACPATSTTGTGTIAVHFTATCIGPTLDGAGFLLDVPTASTDDPFYATPDLGPTSGSQMQMPKNPPSSGLGFVALTFGKGSGIMIGGSSTDNVTVTSGAAIISSDVGYKNAWSADQDALVAAGLPASCSKVDASTFKIDKM